MTLTSAPHNQVKHLQLTPVLTLLDWPFRPPTVVVITAKKSNMTYMITTLPINLQIALITIGEPIKS